MKIQKNRCSVCNKICDPGIDDRCEDCLNPDKYINPPVCDSCGDELSEAEINNGEDTCYPCQKGNR